MLRLFSAGHKDPKPGDRVVYMDGAWDMFHAAHIETLRTARSMGDYLLVGVQGDLVVNRRRGSNLPIMNLYERVLSVLGCKFVDDVLIDAPDELDEQMIKSLGITVVVHGTQWQDEHDRESYKVPRALGIFKEISSVSQLTVNEIRGRILQNEKEYRAKFAKKKKAEDTYYEKRYADITVGTSAPEEAKKTR
jgi:ethanolamine-phosphate cytidylyltransferase